MSTSEGYTYADYRNGMPPRAFGSENEYTGDIDFNKLIGKSVVHGKETIGKIALIDFTDPTITVSRGRRKVGDNCLSSVITTTGGELYIDCGMLEFATAECRTPAELVYHERAGEQIVRDTFQRLAEYQNKDTNVNKAVNVYKRSGYAKVVTIDPNTAKEITLMTEQSVGNHENYTSVNDFSASSYRDRVSMLTNSKTAQFFAHYLALRKIIDGVGMVDSRHYSISQKPRAINFHDFEHVLGHGTKKPFFQNSSRLEVRSGEGNKSDWAKEFVVGLTSLVIRLIEHDKYPSEMMLADANYAVFVLSQDPLGEVWLDSAIKMKGIDILKRIVDDALEIGLASPDFPKYEQKAAADFYQFYNDIHAVSLPDDDVVALSDRIDWAARYQYLLNKGASYQDMTTHNLDMVRDDIKWDRLGSNDSARQYFRRMGHTALHVPMPQPPHTRAKIRLDTIRDIQKKDETLYDISWFDITTGAGKYKFGGPLDATSMHYTPNVIS